MTRREQEVAERERDAISGVPASAATSHYAYETGQTVSCLLKDWRWRGLHLRKSKIIYMKTEMAQSLSSILIILAMKVVRKSEDIYEDV